MSENNEIPCNAGGEPCTVDTLKSTPMLSPLTSAPSSEIQPAPVSESTINTVPVQSESCPLPSTTADIESAKNENSPAQNGTETNNKDELTAISRLEQEVQKRTHERDNYQKKLEEMEKKLSALQASYNAIISGDGDEITLRREMEDLKNMLTQTQLKLDDRGRLVVTQENQINALSKQVSSLKEVVAITKDLLNIRNMEVKHLQNDVDTMENRITAERERHNVMLTKMDTAVRLNADNYMSDLNKASNDIIAITFSTSIIPIVQDDSFVRFKNDLIGLSINYCGVKKVEDYAFRNLTNMRFFSLALNKLEVVRAAWFRDNELRCLRVDLLSHLKKLRSIECEFNPWTWRCQALLMEWLSERGIIYHLEYDGLKSAYNVTRNCIETEINAEIDDEVLNSCVESRLTDRLLQTISTLRNQHQET